MFTRAAFCPRATGSPPPTYTLVCNPLSFAPQLRVDLSQELLAPGVRLHTAIACRAGPTQLRVHGKSVALQGRTLVSVQGLQEDGRGRSCFCCVTSIFFVYVRRSVKLCRHPGLRSKRVFPLFRKRSCATCFYDNFVSEKLGKTVFFFIFNPIHVVLNNLKGFVVLKCSRNFEVLRTNTFSRFFACFLSVPQL